MVVITEGSPAGGEGEDRVGKGHGRRLPGSARVHPALRPGIGDPLSRAFVCRRGRVSAPARFVRLIARARGKRRTHLARRLNRGRSAPDRRGRDAAHGFRFPRTHHSTISENAIPIEKYYMKFSNNSCSMPSGTRFFQIETRVRPSLDTRLAPLLGIRGKGARRAAGAMYESDGPRAGASRNRSNAAWRSRIDADAPSGTTEEVCRSLPTAAGVTPLQDW